MADKQFNPCPNISPFDPSLNVDPEVGYVCPTQPDSQKEVPFFQDITRTDKGIGQSALCDPMQKGYIRENMADAPNRNTIYRRGNTVRGTDEGIVDLFKHKVTVADVTGREWVVPTVWGQHERAVEAVLGENARQDASGVFDRVKLPILIVMRKGFTQNLSRYTYHGAINWLRDASGRPGLTMRDERHEKGTVLGLTRGIPIDVDYEIMAMSLYQEDMNQIFEQVITKFSPLAYIRVQGVQWEVVVKLESVGQSTDPEPGDQSLLIHKLVFGLKAESYIPQPIRREKSILSIQYDYLDGVDPADVTQVIAKTETNVDGFNP